MEAEWDAFGPDGAWHIQGQGLHVGDIVVVWALDRGASAVTVVAAGDEACASDFHLTLLPDEARRRMCAPSRRPGGAAELTANGDNESGDR